MNGPAAASGPSPFETALPRLLRVTVMDGRLLHQFDRT
jgi:hypothetical protein